MDKTAITPAEIEKIGHKLHGIEAALAWQNFRKLALKFRYPTSSSFLEVIFFI